MMQFPDLLSGEEEAGRFGAKLLRLELGKDVFFGGAHILSGFYVKLKSYYIFMRKPCLGRAAADKQGNKISLENYPYLSAMIGLNVNHL